MVTEVRCAFLYGQLQGNIMCPMNWDNNLEYELKSQCIQIYHFLDITFKFYFTNYCIT